MVRPTRILVALVLCFISMLPSLFQCCKFLQRVPETLTIGEGGAKRDIRFKKKVKYLATSSKSILEGGYHKFLQQLEICFGSSCVEAVRTDLVFKICYSQNFYEV